MYQLYKIKRQKGEALIDIWPVPFVMWMDSSCLEENADVDDAWAYCELNLLCNIKIAHM